MVPGIWVLQPFYCWVDRKAWAVKHLTRRGSVQQPAAVLYVKMLQVLCNSGGTGWKACGNHCHSTSFP